ncbi:MAG: lysine 2,3-aminomutase, partial [Candidatus Marinimicrobia bacterium]|nr:lysine 2,3-aminomutase [Candidatus Neomarinimicrobiota bacterium]
MTIFNEKQQELTEKIDADALIKNWKDWKWQLKHSIRDVDTFEVLLGIKFSEEERQKIDETIEKFPLSITPYYLSLIDETDYRNDPVYKQSFPLPSELNIVHHDMLDPLAEDKDSPVPLITHRYPDRVLFHVSNICSMYCRHCTRKRKVGDWDTIPNKSEIQNGIKYIAKTPMVRDVLLSGGDPFLLSDTYLDWILTELKKIPHVEVI